MLKHLLTLLALEDAPRARRIRPKKVEKWGFAAEFDGQRLGRDFDNSAVTCTPLSQIPKIDTFAETQRKHA